eukprot:SM000066S20458  [mRNA]  locus=s66:411245:421049:- [translate_table: standard]
MERRVDDLIEAQKLHVISRPSTSYGRENKGNEHLQISAHSRDLHLGGGAFVLPALYANRLYPHQRKGIEWLWHLRELKRGGILGDDMGLGKTFQVAAYLAGMFNSRLVEYVMIVVPTTLLNHWVNELSNVGLERHTYRYSSCETVRQRSQNLLELYEGGGILLTTYELVWRNLIVLSRKRPDQGAQEQLWDYLILDEGHLVKNPHTKRCIGMKMLPYEYCIIVTGTAVQNGLKDLWTLFDLGCQGLLGTYKEFHNMFGRIIEAGNNRQADPSTKRSGRKAAESLRETIAPFFLRRMKSEVFPQGIFGAAINGSGKVPGLPHKTDLIVWLPLSPSQRRLYEAFLETETVSIARKEQNALAALTVMKKICDHPSLLTAGAAKEILSCLDQDMPSKERVASAQAANDMAQVLAKKLAATKLEEKSSFSQSCKTVFLFSLLERLIGEGHRTLVFSQTRTLLNIIQAELQSRAIKFGRIDGQTVTSQEIGASGDLSAGQQRVSNAADHASGRAGAHIDCVDDQSVDRAYRMGQRRNVIVYRLISASTIEEKMYARQVVKGGLLRSATENRDQFRYFTPSDLQDLFRIPKEGFEDSHILRRLHKDHAEQHLNTRIDAHMTSLKELNIVGVSHHDVLYSKDEPEVPDDYDTEGLPQGPPPGVVPGANCKTRFVEVVPRSSKNIIPSSSDKHAASAKDILQRRQPLLTITELHARRVAELRNQLQRQTLLLAQVKQACHRRDKTFVGGLKLPDNGAKLSKKITTLQEELRKVQKEGSSSTQPTAERLIGEGHRTLVFSQTRTLLNIIQVELQSRAIRFGRIDGQLLLPKRLEQVEVVKGGLLRNATENRDQIRYFTTSVLEDLFRIPEAGFDNSHILRQLHKDHPGQFLNTRIDAHIALLMELNIVGVSRHDILYSKDEPADNDNEELLQGPPSEAVPGADWRQPLLTITELHARRDAELHNQLQRPLLTIRELHERRIAELRYQLQRQTLLLAQGLKLPGHGAKLSKKITTLQNELQFVLRRVQEAGSSSTQPTAQLRHQERHSDRDAVHTLSTALQDLSVLSAGYE